MNKFLGTGRYLCMLYYRGILKPSAAYEPNSAEWILARSVEIPLEQSSKISTYWRELMSGDLTQQKSRQHYMLRKTVAGGGATFTGVQWRGVPIESLSSVDGRDPVRDAQGFGGLTVGEIMLYASVGETFTQLLQLQK